MSNALKFRTIANGSHKQATTHFGVTYDVTKDVNSGRWAARVTSPNWIGEGELNLTDTLAEGATFNQAIKACNDAEAKV